MIGRRIILKRGNRDEAEKPFWISFADLMTALMVLFLISLSAALVKAESEKKRAEFEKDKAVKAQRELALAKAELERREKERDTRRERRTAEVKAFLDEVDKIVRRHEGVVLDRERHVINFGTRAQFASDKHEINLEQANELRRLVPELLGSIRAEVDRGSSWLKRVVVEGFADERGSYLHNLNLSLQRSQRVLCVLLAREWTILVPAPLKPLAPQLTAGTPPPAVQLVARVQPGLLVPIAEEDEQLIRSLFLVGGYSSNSQLASPEASRRIELRIEFFQLDEERVPPKLVQGDLGKCAIGAGR